MNKEENPVDLMLDKGTNTEIENFSALSVKKLLKENVTSRHIYKNNTFDKIESVEDDMSIAMSM